MLVTKSPVVNHRDRGDHPDASYRFALYPAESDIATVVQAQKAGKPLVVEPGIAPTRRN